jgi:hypothetical protein
MPTRTGLWIDHRKAVIVALTEHGEERGLVIAKAERQLRRTGEPPFNMRFETRTIPADDRRMRAYDHHLRLYYDAVIASLRDAEAIWIFGPGEVKTELRKRLEDRHMADRVVGVKPADEMTDAQVAAKVRKHFPLRYPVMVTT